MLSNLPRWVLVNCERGLYGYDATGDPVEIVVNDPAAFGLTYDPNGVGSVNYDGGGDGSGSNPYAFKGGTVSRAAGPALFPVTSTRPSSSWMVAELTRGDTRRVTEESM
jgi:hypothetical protein